MQQYKDELKIKKRRKFFLKLTFFGLIGAAILAGLVYLLFFARLLDVRIVDIQTPGDLRADLSKSIDSWLDSGFLNIDKRNNILFFSANKLSAQLVKQFPKLDSIKIVKKLPHSLFISSDERRPVGIWCSANRTCFYFDKDGIAFSKAQPSAGFLIVNIADYRPGRNIELGSAVETADWLGKIISARELLNKAGINIAEFIIPTDSFDEFHAKTAENWKIMFSIQTDIQKQISALSIFLKEKIKPNQKSVLQYVDLRIQDRIYYK